MEAGMETKEQTKKETFCDVQIRYFGAISVLTGKRDEVMVLPPNTSAYGLLQKLSDIHGVNFRDEIFADTGKDPCAKDIREDLMVTINDKVVKHDDIAGIYLQSTDIMSLFPVFPGGG